MFGANTQTIIDPRTVQQATDKAAYRNFGHAAASIRKTAIASIVRSPEPGPPLSPLRTRRGLLRRGHRYHRDKAGAVIGTAASIAGDVGRVQFGGVFRRLRYQPRPVIVPALMKNLGRFHRDWRGSIT